MKKLLFTAIILLIALVAFFNKKESAKLPIIAIANYGPHSSLDETIIGIKQELTKQGYLENQNIRYDILDVGFDTSLIPQMISKLKMEKPVVMVTMTTPVAQFAKNTVKAIPLVFTDITDPISAGLIKNKNQADDNMTGASEQQDLELLLNFTKQMLPHATRIGLLYSTAESNDKALVSMLEKAALQTNMRLVAIPIDQPRDVPMRMQGFKGKVDFIYVGTSGPIQPTLPTIVANADKMGIPIFNADSDAVKNNQALASFGVDYRQIGVNTGNLVAHALKTGILLPPTYPEAKDHSAFVSRAKAKQFQAIIPDNAIIVE